MDCSECIRLRERHEVLMRAYEIAMARWLALGCDDTGQFMLLKTMADEAKVDLELMETQIVQHQGSHAAD